MRANRCPGRLAARSGLVMAAAIMARTTLWRASISVSRNSVAKPTRSTGSSVPATGARASAGSGQAPVSASISSDGRSGK